MPPASRKQPFRRRALFVALAAAVVLVTIELAAAAAWWWTTGSGFTWSAAAAARASARRGEYSARHEVQVDPGNSVSLAMARCALHPYLGYVFDASLPENAGKVTPYGFLDEAPPLRRRGPDRFLVAVTGGSVAMLMCAGAKQTLIDELQRSPALRGRRVEVVVLAVGGYKQPQQLLSLQLVHALGGEFDCEFDCVVDLDGYNDVVQVQEDLDAGVPPWFPRSWRRFTDANPDPAQLRRIGHLAVLLDERTSSADAAESWWWSPTAQFLWLVGDRRRGLAIAEQRVAVERAASAPSFAATGPGRPGRTIADARAEMVEVWRRSSLAMHALCEQMGARYFHFVQPNQYVPDGKPIGPAEAAVAVAASAPGIDAVRAGYPLLREAGARLVRDGVRFQDLSWLFRDHPEPLYIDTCCHLNHAGYVLLAAHLAASIRRHLELDGVEFTRLRVSPPVLRMESPLRAERPAVYGVTAAGVEHEITGSGFGTALVPPVPADWVVGGGGELRALRRGRATFAVRNGALATEFVVEADWPDVVDEATGRPTADGAAPHIAVVRQDDRGVTVRCSGLPTAGQRVLVAASGPVPDTLPPDPGAIGLVLLPVPPGATEHEFAVPHPAERGRPLFLRCVVLAADLRSFTGVSNAIAVTR